MLLASRALVAIAARSLSAVETEVTLPQYRALVVLASRGPQRAADLAEELRVASSTVTRLCDRLVRKGLIRRQQDRANRRELRISITADGRHVVDRVTAARRAEIERIVKTIPRQRRTVLVQALEEFGRATGEVPEQAWSGGWGL